VKQDVIDKLCKDFKVDEDTCKAYNNLFYDEIEKNIKSRYLSHLVSTIEDMINDIFKKKYIIPLLGSDQYTVDQKRVLIRRNYRLYSILLRPLKGLHRKGFVQHHNFGSIIVYNPEMDDREIRILIAHELGHIINLYILHCEDTQNRANVFSYVAINGKDQFYKNEAERFKYSSELAIIDNIFSVCPILKYQQKDT